MAENNEMWYVIEDDKGTSLVDQDAILTGDSEIAIGDSVSFFYSSRSYTGKVIMKNVDRELLNNELTKQGKNLKRCRKPKENAAQVPYKRRSKLPERFSSSSTTSPVNKKSNKNKNDKELKQLKEAGEKAMYHELLGSDKHAEHERRTDKESEDSDDCPDFLSMIQEKQDKRNARTELVLKIKKNETQNKDSDGPASPTKDELKRMLAEAQEKLLTVYDDNYDEEDGGIKYKEGKRRKHSRTRLPSLSDEGDNNETKEVKGIKYSKLSEHQGVSEESFDPDQSADDPPPKMTDSQSSDVKSVKNAVIETEDEFYEPSVTGDTVQLFGNGDGMVSIGNGVYCKKTILDSALKVATKPSHLVRRMLTGVFKEEAIANSTLTGRKPTAAGKNNYEGEVHCLNPAAVNAVYAYTRKVGAVRRWDKKDMTDEKLNPHMTQRIGEVSRKLKNGQSV